MCIRDSPNIQKHTLLLEEDHKEDVFERYFFSMDVLGRDVPFSWLFFRFLNKISLEAYLFPGLFSIYIVMKTFLQEHPVSFSLFSSGWENPAYNLSLVHI